MRIVRKSLTQEAAETMVRAFVTSRMDYCNSILYGASAVHIRPLKNVFNAAARLILHKGKYDRITAAIRDSLHWLPVQQRIEYKICVLVYKCLHQAAPIYTCLNCVFRLLHSPAGVICVLQWKNASSSVTAGLRTMDSEAFHTLAQLYETHCHWQFVTRRCHCCSSVHD